MNDRRMRPLRCQFGTLVRIRIWMGGKRDARCAAHTARVSQQVPCPNVIYSTAGLTTHAVDFVP
eukprot:38956-Eustigmatos_ZCMA.PRE.1